ncbi:hypothetical protein LTR35_015006 [Friedmanniomyces endolithicus]|nr:hypothetical protein LTR35_015006 [Friedmanniomyces endolithicus]KAK0286568.1 hypothetical protein LTS00_010237 [Friedmanniomyces endolithicus]KAK0982977.1 hypothetical protein LTR54_014542 [Friedmanniomyces endolithicus]
MGEPKERPLHELLAHEMVDLYVGEENTKWTLHEKLLCHRSKFFRNIFHKKEGAKESEYSLPDDDDEPFRMFVAWLYSDHIPTPKQEKDLSPLLELYLMGEKWEIKRLIIEVLDAVRRWYHDTDTWPGLRRVQYIYGNTELESPMRQLLVQCVARMLVLGDGMPEHWEKALRKNGQLAVDLILCVQKWHFDPGNVPDAREESVAPIVEEAEQKVEIKREQEGDDGEEEEEMANGIEHEEEEGEEGEEEEGGEEEAGEEGEEEEHGEEEEQGEEVEQGEEDEQGEEAEHGEGEAEAEAGGEHHEEETS